MAHILTWTKLTLAALAVAALAGTAFAGEGNGPSFPGNDVPNVILGQTTFLPAPVQQGGAVTGSTLSLGAERGTPTLEHRQSVGAYWAQQAAHAQHHAASDNQPG